MFSILTLHLVVALQRFLSSFNIYKVVLVGKIIVITKKSYLDLAEVNLKDTKNCSLIYVRLIRRMLMKSWLQDYLTFKSGSRIAVTSKVELFQMIVNSWKSLTIITKSSILDDATVLDPPLVGKIL